MHGSKGFYPTLILLGLMAVAAMLVKGAPAPAALTAKRVPKPPADANELGQVPILEYHLIGRPESEWRRTPDNFRRDLQMLHDLDYYPVRLLDYVAGRMDVPAGRSPVVLTFDDSSEGQFRAVTVNGRPRPDPDSAVGIMEDFARRYPDFPARATFYLLPGIDEKLRLFGQPEYRAWKLNYLVKHGYELGNHTLWHQNLAKAESAAVVRQLALAQQAVAELVPGYRFGSLSLPFGAWPRRKSLAVAGTYEGTTYKNLAIMLVGAGPAPSPNDRGFNPLALPRIHP